MIYNFYCSSCNRECDSNCVNCKKYNEILLDRLLIFENKLLDIKDIFDNCEDDSHIKVVCRLNMASAFDTAVDLFDDIFNDPICTDITLGDYNNLPDKFDLQFFDGV